jgi:hypothetical protein
MLGRRRCGGLSAGTRGVVCCCARLVIWVGFGRGVGGELYLHAVLQNVFAGSVGLIVGVHLDHDLVEILNDIF